MKLTINLDPVLVGPLMRYASDKGSISWESACCLLLMRALAHFGYL